MSAGFVLFMNPYQVVPGGVYGLGIVLHALFPSIQVGTFRPDVRYSAAADRTESVRADVRCENGITAALLIPVLMNTMTYFIGENPATMFGGKMDLSNDLFLVCIFGGVLIGAGLGMIIKTEATSGGTDIVAMLLVKYARFSFSRGVLLVDSLVVIFGMVVLGDWRLPLYSLVTIFVTTRVIDFIVDAPVTTSCSLSFPTATMISANIFSKRWGAGERLSNLPACIPAPDAR